MNPTKVDVEFHRICHLDADNNKGYQINLLLVDELRNNAFSKQVAHQNKIARYYNFKIKHRLLYEGDLVLEWTNITKKN